MKKLVILYSSGLDSKIMLQYAKVKYPEVQIKCLYYQHGADSEQEEIKRLPDFVEIRKIDWLGNELRPIAKKSDPFAGAIYIPGRNLVFSVLAASQEICDQIWMGTLYDEDNSKGTDKNEKFRQDTSELLTYVLSPFIDKVTVRFPFVDEKWTKVESVKWALENGLTKEELIETVSCWHHKGKPCGQCKQCLKRWLVFKLNGFEEIHVSDPITNEYGLTLLNSYLYEVKQKNSDNLDEINVVKMILSCYEKNLLPKSAAKIVENYV